MGGIADPTQLPPHNHGLVVAVIDPPERGSRSWQRNDRLVGVAGGPKGHAALRSLTDVDPFRLEAIESFFATYHQLDGEKFRVTARSGATAAEAAIRKAHAAFVTNRKPAGDAEAPGR
jgi:hypothetical protein